jgi:hypothetical protein
MKIAILGTRGIPNNYGGFEQFAEYLSLGLVEKGHEVTVFSSSEHTYSQNTFKGVTLIHVYCPEKKYGPLAHFIYDWKCTKIAKQNNFDIIYHAGYQSAAPAIYWFNKHTTSSFVTNMDGLEWKRDKWSKPIKTLTMFLEKLAIKHSDFIISDNLGIQKYYKDKHDVSSKYLAYGADLIDQFNEQFLKKYSLKTNEYYILIARLEPENNINMIVKGFMESNSKKKLFIIGNHETKYGNFIKANYSDSRIIFAGAIYDKEILDSLRYFAKAYFHGHTVGGTNPSLLEAMASKALILSHNNEFNKSVLEDGAFYFNDSKEITSFLENQIVQMSDFNRNAFLNKNVRRIKEVYSWSAIIKQHELFFKSII